MGRIECYKYNTTGIVLNIENKNRENN